MPTGAARTISRHRRRRMMVSAGLMLLLGAGLPHQAAAQQQPASRKQARATRIASGAVDVDGRLDDAAWQAVPAITDFVQVEPVQGEAPRNPMEVRIAFDDDALYIGARMHTAPGTPIQAPLSRRDDGAQAEYLQIELDTYLDRRTAYMFGVTAAGVRMDHYHAADTEATFDAGFDPVWRAATEVTADGWTAELWIPFSQLRFTDQAQRVWGLNLKRWIPNTEEQDYWAPVLRTERGWASRFGDLHGIDGVQPKPRLEALPYAAATSRVTGQRDTRNPFDNGLNLSPMTGADVKIGVGSSLTLDASINPDFGQVEADPAEVNLSANETIFPEKRPFFLEGDNLLHGQVDNFYYSRRIGARPIGVAAGDYVDYPRMTTILGAAKLTGRLASGTSIGFLAALTDQEHAKTSVHGVESQVLVAPRAAWGIGRVQQEFGREASTVGFTLQALDRQIADGDPLGLLLTRRAITGVTDSQLHFGNRTYEAELSFGFTHLEGEPAAIERVQRTTVHLFQSPDRPAVHLDPTRRTLTGLHMETSFNKVAGRHWLWGSNFQLESPGFDSNDMGRVNFASDIRISQTQLTYRQTQPGRHLRAYAFKVNLDMTPYWGGALERPKMYVAHSADATFNNFWVGHVAYTPRFGGQDIQLTRGGPSMGTPSGHDLAASLKNRASSKTSWLVSSTYSTFENGAVSREVDGSTSFRPSPRWQFTVTPKYVNEVVARQYVTSLAGGRPETFGRRYIFGVIDRTTLSSQLRVSYTFKPDMTLDVYAEPFAASGRYDRFGELEAARSQNLRTYGENGITQVRLPDGTTRVVDGTSAFSFTKPDFNVRSFRSNVVLKWEWRPGSTLFLVWQQDRASEEAYGDHVGPRDLFGSFSAPGDNVFVVKTTLWLSR